MRQRKRVYPEMEYPEMEKPEKPPLPKFERPPVVETVLGVQFDRLKRFRNAHLGLFWSRLGPDWAHVEDAQTLEPQVETFGELAGELSGIQKIKFSQSPAARLQVRNSEGNRMIQLQHDRFHFNWLGQGGEGIYPSYDKVLPEFERFFSELGEFAKGADLGGVVPKQWEVTYVNHIPKGTVWTSPQDWADLFRCSGVFPEALADLRLESITTGLRYEIPDRRGRVHVKLQHGRLDPRGEEMLVLTFTARGPVDKGQLTQGLDLGHEAIVRLFTELTSDEAHEHWGRVA